MKPLLMRKGTSRLALYGLGNIRDDRLNRIFENKKVTLFRPTEDTHSWFNMLVLHQNRIAHSAKNYLPTQYLENVAGFMDLLVWGHEHECLIDPKQESSNQFHITQPGSSVATSLCEGEAVQKHIGILEIHGDLFKFEKIPLKSIRPFVIDHIVLSNIKDIEPNDRRAVEDYVTEKVIFICIDLDS